MMLPKARNAAPLPPLMPGRPSSQMTAAAPQVEIHNAAVACACWCVSLGVYKHMLHALVPEKDLYMQGCPIGLHERPKQKLV